MGYELHVVSDTKARNMRMIAESRPRVAETANRIRAIVDERLDSYAQKETALQLVIEELFQDLIQAGVSESDDRLNVETSQLQLERLQEIGLAVLEGKPHQA
jgi:hypothetical protein